MKDPLFEYCVEFDDREMWIQVSEVGISHWYDRAGALEAIPETLVIEKRVFLEFLLGVRDSQSARRMARWRENFTITVELPAAVLFYIRALAKRSAVDGMTAEDETGLNSMLEPVFRKEIQEFFRGLIPK